MNQIGICYVTMFDGCNQQLIDLRLFISLFVIIHVVKSSCPIQEEATNNEKNKQATHSNPNANKKK